MRWNRGLVLTSLFKHSHRNEESVLHALGKPPVWVTSERRSGLMNVVDSTWSGRVTSPRSPLTSIYVSQPKVASRTWNIAYAVIKQTSTSKPRVGTRNERGWNSNRVPHLFFQFLPSPSFPMVRHPLCPALETGDAEISCISNLSEMVLPKRSEVSKAIAKYSPTSPHTAERIMGKLSETKSG